MSAGKLLKHAQRLGAAGFRVHPLHRKDGKVCRVNGWPEKAATDADAIAKLWNGRDVVAIAVATGEDWTVVDLDVPGDSHEHDGAVALKAAGVELPETLTIRTSSGGTHRVYRTRGGQRRNVANVEHPQHGKLLGVDVRGAGGFVKVHDVRALLDGVDRIADCPEWLPLAEESTGHARRGSSNDLEEWLGVEVKRKPSAATRAAVKAVPLDGGTNGDLPRILRPILQATLDRRGRAWAYDTARERWTRDYPDAKYAEAFDRDFARLAAEATERTPTHTFKMPKPPKPKRRTLDECFATFQKWLGAEYDTDAVLVMLAASAVEQLGGDPAWPILISGSGAAKTETVAPFEAAGAIAVSTIHSEAALLSATPGKERAKDATGGLLEEVGSRGIIAIKDLTSILSMDRTERAKVLGALREIYDGSWTRRVGAEGGRAIPWTGRVVVLAACTTAWDTHHSVIASMGDRFVLLRLDSTVGRVEAGLRAAANTGNEKQMRRELGEAVAGVLRKIQRKGIDPTDAERARIIAAADVVALARTAVEFDFRGEVVDAHAPEMPTRLMKQLVQILRGAIAVGASRQEALRIAMRVARDSMPPMRLAVLDDLAAHPRSTVTDIRRRVEKPRATVARQAEALHMLGLLSLDESGGTVAGQKVWQYSLAPGIDPAALIPPTPKETR